MVAAGVLDSELIDRLPGFKKRMQWFIKNRKGLSKQITCMESQSENVFTLLAIPSKERLVNMIEVMIDESEFLSDFGIRSMSKCHDLNPFELNVDGQSYSVRYNPGESDSHLFGGNSNWRGPIWFPVNYLLIESLHQYHSFYGDGLKVECPKGSGNMMTVSYTHLTLPTNREV